MKLKKLFEETIRPSLNEYTPVYRTPLEICPSFGFQKLENLVPKNVNESGYCQLWSMFMMETILLNPTLNTEDIIENCLIIGKADPTYFKNIIRGYTQNMALEIETFLGYKNIKLGSKETYELFYDLDISKLIQDTINETAKRNKPLGVFNKTPTKLSNSELDKIMNKIDKLTKQDVYVYYSYLNENELNPPYDEQEHYKLKNLMLGLQYTMEHLTNIMYDFLLEDQDNLKFIRFFIKFGYYPPRFISNHIENSGIDPVQIKGELLNKYPKFHIFWREYHKSKNTPTTITPKEQKRIQQYINKLPMSKVNTYLSLMLYYHTRATDQSDFDKILDKKEKLYETMIANKINLQNIENWADMF